MIVLGLDMSYTGTGWCVLDATGNPIDCGVIRTASTMTDQQRQKEITDGVFSIYPPSDLVGIEGYSMASKGNAVLRLAELGGVMRWRLTEWSTKYVEIAPGTWKKAVCGKGNLDKAQCRLEIYKRYGFEHANENVVDAFGVAMCTHKNYGQDNA